MKHDSSVIASVLRCGVDDCSHSVLMDTSATALHTTPTETGKTCAIVCSFVLRNRHFREFGEAQTMRGSPPCLVSQ